MAEVIINAPTVASSDPWTPCWSAHAYGWDGEPWWRANSTDSAGCQCSAEKIARNREQGRLIIERRKMVDHG